MATYLHPDSLNPLQRYRQAGTVLRQTSRASNPGWYQAALDLDFQLHLRSDGSTITSSYYDRKKSLWTNGPTLAVGALVFAPNFDSIAADILRHSRAQGATAIGVILHIGDEFATAELRPDLDNVAELSELRQAAISDPASILSDTLVQAETAAWRVFPYPAAGGLAIATAVTLSNHYAPLFEVLRKTGEKENFPIITHALSAPLVAIMGLSQALKTQPERPFIAILQYPTFTTLAFFNEHADLRLIRTLQHRGANRPTNFRNVLATTSASLEFVDPDLLLMPLAQVTDNALAADLKYTFEASRVEVITRPHGGTMPPWAPEPALSVEQKNSEASAISSHTFTILREEKWALQNFLPTAPEFSEVFPSGPEMKLLRLAKLARLAGYGLALAALGYCGYSVFDATRQDAWANDSANVAAAKGRLAKLTQEQQKTTQLGNLLDDRSKTWPNLESLARMFPKDGGMLVKTYVHSAKPEAAVGVGAAKASTVGMMKEWKITGMARDQALDFLNTINTREGVAAHFAEIAKLTGNAAFLPNEKGRSLTVNVRTQENSSFKADSAADAAVTDDSSYPYSFDLTITQHFDDKDPLALSTTKAP